VKGLVTVNNICYSSMVMLGCVRVAILTSRDGYSERLLVELNMYFVNSIA